jgi:hypothetical protein
MGGNRDLEARTVRVISTDSASNRQVNCLELKHGERRLLTIGRFCPR